MSELWGSDIAELLITSGEKLLSASELYYHCNVSYKPEVAGSRPDEVKDFYQST
jgi:hypothetical protein